MENEPRKSRLMGALNKILSLGLLSGALYYGYQKIDMNKIDPGSETIKGWQDSNEGSHIVDIDWGLVKSEELGLAATSHVLKGTTVLAPVYEGGSDESITTISASLLLPGKIYHSKNALRIVGDVKNVEILANERLLIEGNADHSKLHVMRVPIHQTSLHSFTTTFPDQFVVDITGAVTNSYVSASDGDIHAGSYETTTFCTDRGYTYIGSASPESDNTKITHGTNGQRILMPAKTAVTRTSDGSTVIVTQGQSNTSVRTVITPTL